jgi:hypothetical protein
MSQIHVTILVEQEKYLYEVLVYQKLVQEQHQTEHRKYKMQQVLLDEHGITILLLDYVLIFVVQAIILKIIQVVYQTQDHVP